MVPCAREVLFVETLERLPSRLWKLRIYRLVCDRYNPNEIRLARMRASRGVANQKALKGGRRSMLSRLLVANPMGGQVIPSTDREIGART